MKKLCFYAVMFAAGFAAMGCSSDNDVVQEQTSLNNKFDAKGNAYVNIAINMPTSTGGTRANETYDDGLATEYNVKDAVLVLFNGSNTNEGAATFVSASVMNNSVGHGLDNVRISDKILFTQKINKGTANLTGSTGLMAFLVVNANGKFVVGDDNTLTINGTPFSGTFADLKALTLDNIGNTTDGLLMTNAPMSSKPGKGNDPSGASISYLTAINADDIYNSETDAYNGDNFIDIFVERAAAKVNVTSSANGTLIDGTVTYSTNDIKWIIENYNTDYYIERKISNSYFGSTNAHLASVNYRFVDSQPVETNFTLYRTYWAEDPNMGGVPDDHSTIAGTQADITGWNALSAINYIAENTINQNSLKQENTTRVILAVPFNNGNDFYTTSWAGSDIIVSSGDIAASALAFVKSLPSYSTWKAAQSNPSYDVTAVTVTPTEVNSETTGAATITAISVSSGASDAGDILTEANQKSQISYFKDGLAYYKVLIRHFDDTEAPLAHTVNGTTYNDIYGDVEANRTRDFLGRYGIVRNNWYNIDLQGIKHIGKPSVPEIPADTPNDEIDAYLKVRINILSWAKRRQSVTL
jgi:hypothetical protein